MRTFKVLLVAFLLLLPITFKTFAQIKLSDQAHVTLLTCGPGNELYSVFGHTAIRIYDPGTDYNIVYNFGTFDFDTPNFYLKFVKGDMQYFVSTSSYEDFVITYQAYNRDVYEQDLNLSQQEKQNITDELNNILLTDRRFYTYKFIDRNCTTMVADIINKYIPNRISLKNADSGKTNRKIIYEYLSNSFYENLGISLMFGYKTDKEMYKLFLPQQLLEGVSHTTVTAGPLTKGAVTVFKSTQESQTSLWNNFYTYALACLLLMYFSKNRIVLRSLLAIFGLIGLFFCIVGFFSFHDEISQNYNALLINPLFLLLLVFVFTKNTKAIKLMVNLCFACLLIYIAFMLNKPHIFIIIPLLALVTVLLLRTLKTAKKGLNF